jgi:hypothetical protein
LKGTQQKIYCKKKKELHFAFFRPFLQWRRKSSSQKHEWKECNPPHPKTQHCKEMEMRAPWIDSSASYTPLLQKSSVPKSSKQRDRSRIDLVLCAAF